MAGLIRRLAADLSSDALSPNARIHPDITRVLSSTLIPPEAPGIVSHQSALARIRWVLRTAISVTLSLLHLLSHAAILAYRSQLSPDISLIRVMIAQYIGFTRKFLREWRISDDGRLKIIFLWDQ